MKLMRVPDQICHTSITSDEYALLFCMQLVVNIHWELHDEIHAHLQWLLWSEWSKLGKSQIPTSWIELIS